MVGQTQQFSRPFLVVFRHLQALLQQLFLLVVLELAQIKGRAGASPGDAGAGKGGALR
jgi:hypothetical protein